MDDTIKVFRAWLFGFLVGVIALLPALYYFKHTPLIQAVLVPNTKEFHRADYELTMAKVQTPYGVKDIVIYVRGFGGIQKAFQEHYPGDKTQVMGFTTFNDKTDRYEIWSVADPQIIVHELRHVWEGAYHR